MLILIPKATLLVFRPSGSAQPESHTLIYGQHAVVVLEKLFRY